MARLRETPLPLAEKFHRMAGDAIDGIRRQRQMPSVAVERAVPLEIRLASAERNGPPTIEQVPDGLSGPLSGFPECEPVSERV